MRELLPAWPLLAAFLLASVVLAITPGPGVFYVVTRTLAQGRLAGVALGNLGNAIGASIGLAALFAISSFAFTVVKYAGAVAPALGKLRRVRVLGRYLTATAFIGLGILTAVSGSRGSK